MSPKVLIFVANDFWLQNWFHSVYHITKSPGGEKFHRQKAQPFLGKNF